MNIGTIELLRSILEFALVTVVAGQVVRGLLIVRRLKVGQTTSTPTQTNSTFKLTSTPIFIESMHVYGNLRVDSFSGRVGLSPIKEQILENEPDIPGSLQGESPSRMVH